MFDLSKHRTSFFFLALLFLFSGTAVAIMFAKGYKFDLKKKQIVPNGILAADSNPIGAMVLVNGKLKTVTNNTLSLPPGQYEIEIKKEGFVPWKKEVLIEKELVTFAEAFLFPEIPDLKPLTFSGAINPKLSLDTARLVYAVPNPSPDAGLWVMDLADPFLFFSKSPKVIAKSSLNLDLAEKNFYWTADSRQIILEVSSTQKYQLDPNILNTLSSSNSINELQLETLEKTWQEQEELKMQTRLKKIPEKLLSLLNTRAEQFVFSPDSTRLMYVATASAEIPSNLAPAVISASTQKEARKIEPGRLYVYDIKEDRNFEITNYQIPNSKPSPTPKSLKSQKFSPELKIKNFKLKIPEWFPTSRHLVWIQDSKVVACEYDNTNLTTLYSGSFIKPFVFLTPNTNRLVILADIELSIQNPTPTPTTGTRKSRGARVTPTPAPPKTNLFSISLR